MGEFLIGNTFAQLVTPEEAKVYKTSTFKFLWTGVGDLRNPLTTLRNLCKDDSDRNVHLFMNDISPVTFARNIVLLALLFARKMTSLHYAALLQSGAMLCCQSLILWP